MKRIILNGACGKMGRVVADCVSGTEGVKVVAGIDLRGESSPDFPVYKTPFEVNEEADVIIDFSHPGALGNVLAFAMSRRLPVVLATTGYIEMEIEEIKRAGAKIPVFFSANMSLGITLLSALAQKAAAFLGEQFDVEIIEKHHNQKIDAPSGTALTLANAVNSALDVPREYVYDRHSQRVKRSKNEIGIHSLRGGTIPGEHDVVFAGRDEVITLSHTAISKEVFAVGAVKASVFISGQKPGLYGMNDLVK